MMAARPSEDLAAPPDQARNQGLKTPTGRSKRKRPENYRGTSDEFTDTPKLKKSSRSTTGAATPIRKTKTIEKPLETVQLSPRGGLDQGDWGIMLTIYANGLAESKDRDM